MLQYILFDFDGTLVDSKNAVITAFNQIAQRYGFKSIQAEDMDHIRNLSMLDRFRFLGIPLYRLPFLRKEMLRLYHEQILHISFIPGIASVLAAIKDMGLKTGIVSSNSVKIIQAISQANGLPPFDEVYCSGKFFGKDYVFRKFLKKKNLPAEAVVYVCDEQRDITACVKAGIRPVWVSWGFEVADVINQDQTLGIAQTPQQLLDMIMQAQQRQAF